VNWRKSSRSGSSACVEVALLSGGGAAVRHSADREGPMLQFTAGEWRAFVAGARAGEFDAEERKVADDPQHPSWPQP